MCLEKVANEYQTSNAFLIKLVDKTLRSYDEVEVQQNPYHHFD